MKSCKGKDLFGTIFSFIFPVRKLNKILRFPILFLLVFLFTYSTAYSASSYYVDNTVATSGNGSQGSPWKNFSDINWTTMSGASKPCTIYVSGGVSSQTYTFSSAFSIGASGTGVGSEIILKRATESDWTGHGGTVYIVRAGGGVAFNITSRSYVIIDGFDITGGFWLSSSGANVDYITIRNNWIHNWTSADYGAGLTMGTTKAKCNYLTIQNNRIGPPATTATDDPIILGGNTNTIIEGNIIEYRYDITSGSHADGIHVQGASESMTIRYNWFRGGFKNAAIYLQEDASTNNTDGIISADIYGNIIENCYTTSGNTWQGIFIEETNTGNPSYNYQILNIYNNIFANLNQAADEAGEAFRIGPASSSSNKWRVENNIFYNAVVSLNSGVYTSNLVWNNNWYYNNDSIRSGLLIVWKGSEYRSLSSFYSATGFEANYNTPVSHLANPLFTDADSTFRLTHDFRPTASSPTVDRGATETVGTSGISIVTAYSNWPYFSGSGALGTGVTTISRPQGSAWDIGAYECASGDTPPQAPKSLAISPQN